jgi:mono/diheme cytochrome c family protein
MPGPALARERAPRFGADGPALLPEFVFEYLADPQPRRTDIGATRMPDFALDERERLALALFLGSKGTPSGTAAAALARHPDITADLGRRIYGALSCGGCHSGLGEPPSPVGPDLGREGVRVRPEWLRTFLLAPRPVRADGHPAAPGSRMPDFALNQAEAHALSTYLGGLGRRFAELDTTALSPFETRRTRTLMEERLACLGCHEVGREGGYIGPSLNGLSERLRPSFVLEMVMDPARAAPGSMMPHQPLPVREARRVARYLLDQGTAPNPPSRASLADPNHPAWVGSDTAPPDRGAELYARHCASCHGVAGDADGWNAASLPTPPTAHSDPTLMARRLDDTLFDGIHAGAWVLDGSPRMPPFGGLLSPSDIGALVAHIRALCSCSPPVWGRGGGRP